MQPPRFKMQSSRSTVFLFVTFKCYQYLCYRKKPRAFFWLLDHLLRFMCQAELHLLQERETALREKEALVTEAQSSLHRLVAVEVKSKLAEKQQVTDYWDSVITVVKQNCNQEVMQSRKAQVNKLEYLQSTRHADPMPSAGTSDVMPSRPAGTAPVSPHCKTLQHVDICRRANADGEQNI